MMRNTIILFSAIAIMLIGLVGSAVILLDEERLKRIVIAQAESSTGRKVEILGSLRVRLFPAPRLSAEAIVFRQPGDPSGPALFEAERLAMNLRLLPLLRGQPQADEIRLSGARLYLRSEADPGLLLDAELAEAGPGARADLASAPVLVEDLVIQVSDAGDQLRQVFEFEQVYLSGFALDRPVAFRFSGNLGEPPLFDQVEVDGRLISTLDGQVRLEPMRLTGSLEQGRYRIELEGDLLLKGGAVPELRLSDARVQLNEHVLDLGLHWQGLERPRVVAELAAQSLNVDVLAALEQLAGWAQEPGRQTTVAALTAIDFDLGLQVEQVAEIGLVLHDLSLAMSARDGWVRIDALQTSVPGGLLLAEAELDLRAVQPRWQADLDLQLAQAGQLLESLRQDYGLSGAGRLLLQLESSSHPDQLPWQGQGNLSLWDGRWEWLSWMKAQAQIEPTDPRFARLESVLVLGPRRLEWQGLQFSGAAWQAGGQLDLYLPAGDIQGRLRVDGGNGLDHLLELAGSLRQPELLAPPLLIATSR